VVGSWAHNSPAHCVPSQMGLAQRAVFPSVWSHPGPAGWLVLLTVGVHSSTQRDPELVSLSPRDAPLIASCSADLVMPCARYRLCLFYISSLHARLSPMPTTDGPLPQPSQTPTPPTPPASLPLIIGCSAGGACVLAAALVGSVLCWWRTRARARGYQPIEGRRARARKHLGVIREG